MKNRTPNRRLNNLYLGDVDSDGTDEFLQAAENQLFVFRTNFEATGVAHHSFTAPMTLSHMSVDIFGQ